ncbi:type VI secretion system baseplate subunit TssG [Mangrovitalea sediminis]|uniref:type VI secretion system baseplate subunit TssG n=1 Tax=Mangrovitalea sediminis TaxID=1982043 RepID=UPI000BE583AE|nr:type VI secretion system baseplate subunit TssG [Mangrovitalea sediminis]
MATENRFTTVDLISGLQQEPWRFEFFQLVRLLELQACSGEERARLPVGHFHPPQREAVRFAGVPQLHFSAAPVLGVETDEQAAEDAQLEGARQRVDVTFWGLVGATGVLPFHYSEQVLRQLRIKDDALKDFLDIFTHRSLSLFYRAWSKHRPALQFEARRHQGERLARDRFGEIMRGLTGLSQRKWAAFDRHDGIFLNVSGLMSRGVCSAGALQQAILQLFGLRVRVRSFTGNWQTLPDDVWSRVGAPGGLGCQNDLGGGAMLGRRAWATQNKFTVEVDDIDYTRFMDIVAGRRTRKALYDLIRMMAGPALEFDLSLKVQQRDLPVARLASAETPALLGWNTRLHQNTPSAKAVTVSVSRHGMGQAEG